MSKLTLAPTSGATKSASPAEPWGRIVLVAVAAGLAVAVLLVVVLPGAPEHVTTGALLLAFGGGWALLAVLSSGLTSTPQRWAWVPAGTFSATGALLLSAQPSGEAMRAAGFVWPVVLLAMTGWMAIRVRALPPRGRLPLCGVLVVLALACVGGAVQTVSDRGLDASAPGRLVDIGGRRLHLQCSGTGSPTVVLENGLSGSSPMWARVSSGVAPITRVCAYDRAGQGWSDPAPAPPDSLDVVADLRRLLEVAGEPGPYVLVGHSAGGAYAMTYAAGHPLDVAGLVLLDSSGPHQFADLSAYADQYAMLLRLHGIAPTLARLGIGHVIRGLFETSVPGEAGVQATELAVSPRTWRTARDELTRYPEAFEQAAALTSLHGTPLVVVTASQTLDETAGWASAQADLAALSANSSARTVDAAHAGLLGEEQPAEATVQAIVDVVDAARTGRPLR